MFDDEIVEYLLGKRVELLLDKTARGAPSWSDQLHPKPRLDVVEHGYWLRASRFDHRFPIQFYELDERKSGSGAGRACSPSHETETASENGERKPPSHGFHGLLHFVIVAVDQFNDGSPWWSRLGLRRDENVVDLKKLGTFPIVHGVRALALQRRIRVVGTAERLRELAALGVLDDDFVRDLLDALHCLMRLKLGHQLRQRAAGEVPDNLVRPSQLGLLERDEMRDALAIVKRLRQMLVLNFRLHDL